jgi:hypothetical protein
MSTTNIRLKNKVISNKNEKIKKYHTVGTIPQSNIKIVERGQHWVHKTNKVKHTTQKAKKISNTNPTITR